MGRVLLPGPASINRGINKSSVVALPPFAEIVRQHQAMVYSIAWHFLRDRSIAEDLAQDVFLVLHRNLASIESPGHLTNWLRQAMTRRCIDWSRRRSQRGRVSFEELPEQPSPSAGPRDTMLDERISRAISRLPERPRMMVILRYQEDMDPAEIANALDVPIGTVKSTLHRALAVLRTRLERTQNGAAKRK